MNYMHKAFVISLLLSTSLYPAATPPCDANASASATPAGEVKRAAEDQECQGKAAVEADSKSGAATKPNDIWFDAEIDTAGPRERLIDPAQERAAAVWSVLDPSLVDDCIDEIVEYDDVKQHTLEIARELDSPLDILLALAQLYADKDHNLFALDLFKQWKALCEEKGLLYDRGGIKVFIGDTINVNKTVCERGKDIPPIGWCCLGIAAAHSNSHGIYDLRSHMRHFGAWIALQHDIQVSELHRLMDVYVNVGYRALEDFHKLRQEALVVCSIVEDTTPLLPDVVDLIVAYYYSCISVASVLQDAPGSSLEGRMISDLSGLSSVEEESLSLDANLVAYIGERDLPPDKLKWLSINNNPLRDIVPYALQYQTRLTHLSLIGCRLTGIWSDMFAGCTNLQWLFLTGNRISDIERGALSQLRSLWQLSLVDNRLEHVPDDLYDLPDTMMTLRLDENPLERDPKENMRKAFLLSNFRHMQR